MNLPKKIVLWFSAALLIALAICPSIAYAVGDGVDTDDGEIQITAEPDQLVLQLGPQWAGVEFELKTDAGVYPAPVVMDSSGSLTMDLGGSHTYILSCLASSVAAPVPTQPTTAAATPAASADSGDTTTASEHARTGVPVGILILFLCGLIGAAGSLFAMRHLKRHRESYRDDAADDDE